jgi:hypothetical protein
MSQKLWVQHNITGKSFGPTKVSIAGCSDVDDFIKEVKKESQLAIPQNTPITLYHPDGTTEIKVGDSPSDYLEGNTDGNPLIVKVFVAINDCLSEASLERKAIHPNRMKRQQALNCVLDKSRHSKKRKGATEDDDVSTPYSIKTTWDAVKEIFDVEMKSYYEPVLPIPEETFSLLSKYLTLVMKCYGLTLLSGNEAKRLHLIAPIIMCVVSLLPDVVVKVEEDLNGVNVHANGHFEFILIRGPKRICIIEAKEEKFKQGMAQNLVGCEVAVDLDGSNMVCGIVTNFDKWIFIRSKDEEILVDENNVIGFESNGVPTQAGLLKVVGKLYSLLQ